MPQVILNFATASDLQRSVDALCARYGYQAVINGSPNPQTANEFARQVFIKWGIKEVREHELNTARASVTVTDVAIT